MQKEIQVWDTTETVTILAAKESARYRVIWHPSDGSPDQQFEVEPIKGDSIESAIIKELRRRMGGQEQ